MHPRFKTEYFKQHNWPQEWIETAVEITRDIWQTKYKPSNRDEQQTQSSANSVMQKVRKILSSTFTSLKTKHFI